MNKYKNTHITEPYARDMVLEAIRLLTPHYPEITLFTFVEFFDLPGIILSCKEKVVMYHPTAMLELSLDNVCDCIAEAFRQHREHHMVEVGNSFDDQVIPQGVTLH